MEPNQTINPGQKVVCNRFSEINKTLPDGIKKGGIYFVDEVIKCDCGNIFFALKDVYYPGINGRICICGKENFPLNTFYSRRFDLVHLNIVR